MEKFTTEFEECELRGIGKRSLLYGTDKVLVIGTRRATPYGLALADMAGRVVAELGLTLLTSAAIGCGAQAARAAKQAGGEVIVVSAVGLDMPLYPAASKDVFESADLLLSVVDDYTPPIVHSFPRRNILMAQMCDALVACEAGMRSGITTTCNEAHMDGARVYVFPGSVFSQASQGCNQLIAEHRATLVQSENDLESHLRDQFGISLLGEHDGMRPYDNDLMAAITANPMRPDELAQALDKQPVEVIKELATLEMDGKVERLPDGRYSPSVHRLIMR